MKACRLAVLFSLVATLASAQTTQISRAVPAVPTTMQNAAAANGNGTALTVGGYSTATMRVTVSGDIGTGVVLFERSLNGSTWAAVSCWNHANSDTLTVGTSATADFTCPVSNFSGLRARIASYTGSGGTITVVGYPSYVMPAPATTTVTGTVTANAGSGTFTVGGTVTANAGTNLNTSLLALESGGNLDTIAGTDFATSAKQDTGNASLASIDGKITAVNTGAVTITALPNEGQQTMANSISVAVASNQSAIPVDGSGVTQPVSNGGLTELAAAINASSQVDVNIAASTTLTVNAHAVTNAGVFAVQESGAALTALQLIDDVVHVDDTATHATGTSKGVLLMGAATPTDASVSANDIGALAMTADRKLQVSVPDAVTVNAHAVTNAGTFPVQVDGAALTALQLIDDPVQVLGTDTYTEASSKGMTLGAVRRDADTTLVNTTNEFGPLQMDANGRLKVEAFSGETLPVSLTSTTITGSVTVAQATAANLNMTEASAASILTAVQLIDDPVYVDDTATHSTGTSKVMGIGAVATPTDTAVNANDIAMPGMSNNRELWSVVRDAAGNARGANVNASNQLQVVTEFAASTERTPVATATTTNTGLSSHTQSGASTNATNVKASAGNVYLISATSTSTTVMFLRLYNSSGTPTCSSATGFVGTIPIPPASTAGLVGGIVVPYSVGKAFTTGIAFCITGGGSSTDNTNATTGGYVEIVYK